jgi:hypothetical protein
MRLELVATEIHDEVLFLPGHTVSRWVHEVASELHFYTIQQAPMNKRPNKTSGEPPPGHLISSLQSEVIQVGRTFSITENSRAHYTRYVIEGTGTIYARGPGGQFGAAEEGSGMYLPANPGYGRGRWRQRVRGQKANNLTARKHPALKGISME